MQIKNTAEDRLVEKAREAIEHNELIKDVGEATKLYDDIWHK